MWHSPWDSPALRQTINSRMQIYDILKYFKVFYIQIQHSKLWKQRTNALNTTQHRWILRPKQSEGLSREMRDCNFQTHDSRELLKIYRVTGGWVQRRTEWTGIDWAPAYAEWSRYRSEREESYGMFCLTLVKDDWGRPLL